MALEQFIDITGVQGESVASDLRGAIPVVSWSFSVTRPVAPPPDATGDNRPRFAPFTFTKRVDSSTPLLLALCAQAVQVPQARLVVRNPGSREPRVIVDLRDVTVRGVVTEFDRHEIELVEQVELVYARIWFGGAGGDRRSGGEATNWFSWDLSANGPVS